MSATQTRPGEVIRQLPTRAFIKPDRLPGSSTAVRSALSNATRRGEILRVRKGLYYKGAQSRYGMTRPSRTEVASEVLGTVGVGPSGYSAAKFLGLTTQLSPDLHVAVIGPVPEAIAGVRVHKRNNFARHLLTETEIALLEVLRDPAALVESGWGSLVDVARRLIAERKLRLPELEDAVPGEGTVAVKMNFERLRTELHAA